MVELTSHFVDCMHPCLGLLSGLRLFCVHYAIQEISELTADIIDIAQLVMAPCSGCSMVDPVVIEKLVERALK